MSCMYNWFGSRIGSVVGMACSSWEWHAQAWGSRQPMGRLKPVPGDSVGSRKERLETKPGDTCAVRMRSW